MTSQRKQVEQVLSFTLILNLLVAIGKIVVGMMSGALAITADGVHSLTDSAGNVAGLVAIRFAERPPDDDHPYGHRKFETLSALLIGGLLLLTAWEMVQGIIDRLYGSEEPTLTPLTFIVLIVTLLINIVVSRYQIRKGQELKSQILLADAKNTSSDVYVTLSVIVSMGLVAIGWGWMDLVVALIVAGLIFHSAWEILLQTASVLVDTAPYSSEFLREALAGIPSVKHIIRARSRGTTDEALIDIDVQVPREMTADHTEAITSAIRTQLTDTLDGVSEVEVHFVPTPVNEQDYILKIRACADALGLSTHEVIIIDNADGKVVECHVEVPPQQTLDEAHKQVSQLEADLYSQLDNVKRVVTHIEPAQPADETHLESPRVITIQTQAEQLLNDHFPTIDWHDWQTNAYYHGFNLNVHAALSPQITIESAHAIAESAETLLRANIHELSRVTIHTEPYDH
jgi:cation diffusion facilitator family transporter